MPIIERRRICGVYPGCSCGGDFSVRKYSRRLQSCGNNEPLLGLGVKGQNVVLNLSVASITNQLPAILEWQFSYPPADLVFISSSEGPSALAAGKSITCNGGSGSYICIAAGINKNAIPDGVLATLLFTVSATTVNPAPAISISGASGRRTGSYRPFYRSQRRH